MKILNRKLAPLAIAFSMAAATFAGPAGAHHDNELPDLIETLMPSVVNITALMGPTGTAQPQPTPGQPVPMQMATGSGFVYNAQAGYIVTNNHVVENTSEIIVSFNDGRSYDARLIGTDELTDMAVLQIKAKDLQGVTVGDAADLRIGNGVIAIGNPLQQDFSVSTGIISAKNRFVPPNVFMRFLQTDAAINHGNSGGPLFDLHGEMIGMNTAILSPGDSGSIGIGFAIPSEHIELVVNEIIKNGEFERGIPGITSISDLQPDEFQSAGAPFGGVVVNGTQPGMGADNAGIQPGDVITRFNGGDVRSGLDLLYYSGMLRGGDSVKVDIVREGVAQTVTLVMTTRAEAERLRAQQEQQDAAPEAPSVIEETPGTDVPQADEPAETEITIAAPYTRVAPNFAPAPL